MREIYPGEEYERFVYVGGRRPGWHIRKEHSWVSCLWDMEDEWLREHSGVPVAERVAIVTVFKQQVVAKFALDGTTVFETESVPTLVSMTESKIEEMSAPSRSDDEEDVAF